MRAMEFSPGFYRRMEALQRPVAEYSQLEPLVAQRYHSGHSRGSFACSAVLRSARATSFRGTGALAHIYRIFCLSDGIWVKGSRLDRACPLPPAPRRPFSPIRHARFSRIPSAIRGKSIARYFPTDLPNTCQSFTTPAPIAFATNVTKNRFPRKPQISYNSTRVAPTEYQQ